jgi:hypothetical protein
MSANKRQVGGGHYKKHGALQPWDVVAHFNMGFFEGNAFKYLVRYRDKGGVQDLEKAKHYIEKLLELIAAPPSRARGVKRRALSKGRNK